MFTSEVGHLRAIVKNTFVHFERVDEHLNGSDHPCKLKRRASDAFTMQIALEPRKLFEIEAPTTVESAAIENESRDVIYAVTTQTPSLDIDSVCVVVSDTFVHFEQASKDDKIVALADAQADKLTKQESMLYETLGDCDNSVSLANENVSCEGVENASIPTQESSLCKNTMNHEDKYAKFFEAEPKRPIKNTFIHFEHLDGTCDDTVRFSRKSRRRLTDILHARDSYSQAYKLEKLESMSYLSYQSEDEMTMRSENTMQYSECSEGGRSSTPSNANAPESVDFAPSLGSAGHYQGLCRPCVWFLRPGSCNKGSACEYCHLCDEVALAEQAAVKQSIKKLKKRYNRAQVRRAAQSF